MRKRVELSGGSQRAEREGSKARSEILRRFNAARAPPRLQSRVDAA